MSVARAIARSIAESWAREEDLARLHDLHYHDAGHGYDAFGLHPDVISLGMAITRPLYEKYFRVQSHGHHHIPDVGPAILAANHSGNLPIDGMMIWADVLRNTQPPRVPRPIADHFVPALPWLGTLFSRGGMVGGSRGNCRALLEDGNLLMIFPEGVPGIIKPWSKRYQLQHFRVGHAELAIRYGAPVVPVAVVGAEEQMPQLFASRRLGKIFGIEAMPIPITPVPLPVQYHIYYGEPVPMHLDYKSAQADDPDVVTEAAARVQSAVDALIKIGLKDRKGVFG
jgi:1-acyl-sn-glycerol-3-phosphate acyltransferase